jgi:hypothetical protein
MGEVFYYSEDGSIFKSKLEALAYSNKNQKKIFFNYYDDVWSKYDWTFEPPQSLEYYYKGQAELIRNNYDYVVLCYSGGADSTNILETFYYNNIKLDKIAIVGAFSQDSHSGVDENHNGELYHNAFPYIEELRLTSITEVFDYTKMFDDIKNFGVYSMGDTWFHTIQGFYSPHNWFWYDIEKHIIPNEYKDKKVAIIFGKDKPYLMYTTTPEFSFKDVSCLSYATNYDNKSNIQRINFYYDPNYPFILIKQLHHLNTVRKETNYNSKIIENSFINRHVYNLKKPLLFQSGKSKISVFSLRDQFLKEKQNSEVFNFWIDSIRKMNNYTQVNNLPIIKSKTYKIC